MLGYEATLQARAKERRAKFFPPQPPKPAPEPEVVTAPPAPSRYGELSLPQLVSVAAALAVNPLHALRRETGGKPMFGEVVAEVCAHYGIALADIMSARRDWAVVRPRQVAWYLGRKLTGRSLPYLARHMGGKDHTSALNGCRRIEAQILGGDARLAEDIAAISDRITRRDDDEG